LYLHRDKTHRAAPVHISIAANASRFSAARLLRAWFVQRNFQPTDRIFPAVRHGRIHVEATYSPARLRRLIKRVAASIGLDPSLFSGHSLRAGGATDLFAAQVPYPTIKKMGRWVSDAAMLYYRSDEDVWAAVGAAFSALALAHGA
jgi:integrase